LFWVSKALFVWPAQRSTQPNRSLPNTNDVLKNVISQDAKPVIRPFEANGNKVRSADFGASRSEFTLSAPIDGCYDHYECRRRARSSCSPRLPPRFRLRTWRSFAVACPIGANSPQLTFVDGEAKGSSEPNADVSAVCRERSQKLPCSGAA
jgi:hypothetical protein